MSWEQRSHDFSTAQVDAQMAYIEAEREVKRLQAENDKLREQNRYLMKGDLLHVLTDQELSEQQRREREMQASIKALDDENAKLREENQHIGLVAYELGRKSLAQENARLRELVRDALTTIGWCTLDCCPSDNKKRELNERARELGVEV